jgi:uncharacterized iron-regulated membrane protein
MRSLIQLVIPALIVIGVVYWMTRRRSGPAKGAPDNDKGTFIAILVIGGLVAVAIFFTLFGDTGP